MRIKFKSPDPRAGIVAQMDSSRGQQLIDAGAAVQVKDEDAETTLVRPTTKAPVKSVQAIKAAKHGKKVNAH